MNLSKKTIEPYFTGCCRLVINNINVEKLKKSLEKELSSTLNVIYFKPKENMRIEYLYDVMGYPYIKSAYIWNISFAPQSMSSKDREELIKKIQEKAIRAMGGKFIFERDSRFGDYTYHFVSTVHVRDENTLRLDFEMVFNRKFKFKDSSLEVVDNSHLLNLIHDKKIR